MSRLRSHIIYYVSLCVSYWPLDFTPMGSVQGTPLKPMRRPYEPLVMTQRSPFRYFKTSPEIIRLAVMMYIRFPLWLRNVEDLLHERRHRHLP